MTASYVNLKIGEQVLADVILKHLSVIQDLNHHWWCHIEIRHTPDQWGDGGERRGDRPPG